MRVWRSVNPLTSLACGHGGLKLVRRSALREMSQGKGADVLAALPGRAEFCVGVAGVTRFGRSAFHVWKAGFRECATLAAGTTFGLSVGAVGERSRRGGRCGTASMPSTFVSGARDGMRFARQAAQTPGLLERLDDPVWLRDRFTRTHGLDTGKVRA